jgi:hypothetical protein
MIVNLRERKSKYGNTHTCRGDKKFKSSLEARYYDYLCLLKNGGIVRTFLRQVPIDLAGSKRYFCDFVVFYEDGEVDFIDVKGNKTQLYLLKKDEVEALHNIEITEVTVSDVIRLGF